MQTDPLTGARMPEQTDGPLGGLQISNVVKDLRSATVPRFASASAGDTALANAGIGATDGMVRGIGGLGIQTRLGTWRLVPLGVVPGGAARQTSPQSVNSATAVRVVGSTNLQVTLHGARAYKATFTTVAQTDTANAILSVSVHGKSGTGVTPAVTDTLIADGSIALPITGGPGGTTLQFSDLFTVGSSTSYVISVFISRPAGSGTVSISGNTRIFIEDVGDAANLTGFAQLT